MYNLCTIYVQFNNLAIYRAAGNFDFSLFTSPKAIFFILHFAFGEISVISVFSV